MKARENLKVLEHWAACETKPGEAICLSSISCEFSWEQLEAVETSSPLSLF
jgi:hypothetical protein